MVELGAGPGAGSKPAHRAAGARLARGGRKGTVVWPRARASMADAASSGIHDDVVTPCSAPRRLGAHGAPARERRGAFGGPRKRPTRGVGRAHVRMGG